MASIPGSMWVIQNVSQTVLNDIKLNPVKLTVFTIDTGSWKSASSSKCVPDRLRGRRIEPRPLNIGFAPLTSVPESLRVIQICRRPF